MATNVIAVTFEATAQHWRDGQITIPKEICELLGVWQGDTIGIMIIELTSMIQTDVQRVQLKSGNEIYSQSLRRIPAGSHLILTVSRVQETDGKKDTTEEGETAS